MTRPRRSLRDDDRGLAVGLAGFVAILVISAFLFILLDPALSDVFSMASTQADSAQAQKEISTAKEIWGLILFFALFLAMLALITRAVVESRGPS